MLSWAIRKAWLDHGRAEIEDQGVRCGAWGCQREPSCLCLHGKVWADLKGHRSMNTSGAAGARVGSAIQLAL